MTSEVIQVRVPCGTKAAGKTVAADLNYETPSAFYRTAISEAITSYPALDATRYGDIRRLHHAIHKVGVNINQIAHALNMDRRPSDREIRALVDECNALNSEALKAYGALLRVSKKGILK